jgi:hypothetical protein
MYDPVLNRPMFQAQNTATPMAAAPMGAKGTGITSMVTSPDPDTTMQQLKAFANPAMPTVGYADGGPVQHFQEGGLSSLLSRFADSLKIKGETQSPFQGPTPMRSGNYRLPDVGLRIGQQDDYRRDAGITDGNSPNYVEPIDIGGPEAVMSMDQRRALYNSNAAAGFAEDSRAAADRTQDPRIAENLRNDAENRLRQQEKRDAQIPSSDRIREAVGSGASKAILPQPLTREGPDLLELQQMEMVREANRGAGFRNIGQESPPPPPPPPPPPREDRKPLGAISTHLSDIKAERAAQSAADRRENALMALMSAGFGMAAGKSRHALQNIAEGGQQGIGTFAQLEKGRREDENRRYLSALHEQEVALRRQDLEARLPLIAAQTKAQESVPAYREKVAAAREFQVKETARANAAKDYEKRILNPLSPEYIAISKDKTGTVAPAIRKKIEDEHLLREIRSDLVRQNDGLGIRPADKPTE